MTRRGPIALVLAAASLAISACANAEPPKGAAPHLSDEFRTAAEHSNFPKSLSIEGRYYVRLTGGALVEALNGKTFCPSPACSGIDGTVERFQDNGDYLVAGDRYDDQGRYAVIGDTVVVKLGDVLRTYAFYRAADGTLRRAWIDRAGSVKSSMVFTRWSRRP